MEYSNYLEKRWNEFLEKSYRKPEPENGGLAQRIENYRGD